MRFTLEALLRLRRSSPGPTPRLPARSTSKPERLPSVTRGDRRQLQPENQPDELTLWKGEHGCGQLKLGVRTWELKMADLQLAYLRGCRTATKIVCVMCVRIIHVIY